MHNIIFSIFPNNNFVDLGLYQFGWEECEPSHSFGPASRNHFLFHFIISGKGTLMSNDSKGITHTYEIHENEGFMIFPDQINTYISDQNEPWEYVWIEFDGLRVKELIEMTGLSFDNPIYKANSISLRDEMKNEMLYLSKHRDMSSFHLIGHLYLFLDYLSRSSNSMHVPQGSKLQDFYIHEALAYIEQNFQKEITIEDIAQNCGLNRSYFSKIFKDAVGKTPQEFLLNYRMIKAAELLKLSKLSVAKISTAVGYNNPLHFSRAFKKIFGLSPRNWRNENRIKI